MTPDPIQPQQTPATEKPAPVSPTAADQFHGRHWSQDLNLLALDRRHREQERRDKRRRRSR